MQVGSAYFITLFGRRSVPSLKCRQQHKKKKNSFWTPSCRCTTVAVHVIWRGGFFSWKPSGIRASLWVQQMKCGRSCITSTSKVNTTQRVCQPRWQTLHSASGNIQKFSRHWSLLNSNFSTSFDASAAAQTPPVTFPKWSSETFSIVSESILTWLWWAGGGRVCVGGGD